MQFSDELSATQHQLSVVEEQLSEAHRSIRRYQDENNHLKDQIYDLRSEITRLKTVPAVPQVPTLPTAGNLASIATLTAQMMLQQNPLLLQGQVQPQALAPNLVAQQQQAAILQQAQQAQQAQVAQLQALQAAQPVQQQATAQTASIATAATAATVYQGPSPQGQGNQEGAMQPNVGETETGAGNTPGNGQSTN